jgi:hypothetical protein
MKRVLARTSLIAAPVIALAILAPTADAATLHVGAHPGVVVVAGRADVTPTGSPLDQPVKSAADVAGDAFGMFGVGVSKIPVIGPIVTDIGEAITSLFTGVPIVGDAAQSAINTYNDNGK